MRPNSESIDARPEDLRLKPPLLAFSSRDPELLANINNRAGVEDVALWRSPLYNYAGELHMKACILPVAAVVVVLSQHPRPRVVLEYATWTMIRAV